MSPADDQRAADPGATSVGGRLARARLAAGLSVAEVAERIKATTRQIEAVDADDYARLPPPPFTRGFLRSYARLVGLDPAAISAAYDAGPARVAAPAARAVGFARADIPLPSGSGSRRAYALAALAAVAIVLVAFYERVAPAVTATAAGLAAWLPDRSAAAEPAAPAAAMPSAAPFALAGLATPAAPTVSDAAPHPLGRAPAAGNPAHRTLRLTFERESWTEIRDRQGRALLYQLNPGGSTREVDGEPPFLLVIGNAQHVRVTIDDREIDLAPYTRVAVARLTIE
jgi:cytoskeleton protein RodZ